MHRIGLALSGGGFRATLYHLGMIRFLREANILPEVTHITSVSGGSVLAAHLVLNWHRYNDSLKEFDAAAAEVIRFVQMDVRNRVVRRYPLAMPLRGLGRLALRRPHRQLSRTGLLEYHYEKFLYGDTCLFQLPLRPRLHILATNLSEGCLCAFTRDGLLMQRRRPGRRFHFDRIHTGLATLPMAVTASSAFPGFFPPLELRGQDVGADPGQFDRAAFTDGGVYDNLGVRMFRCLERSWLAREVRLQRDDLADVDEMGRAFESAAKSSEDTPLRRLTQMMALSHRETAQPADPGSASVDRLLEGLWEVMNHENLAREPVFARLSPPDPDVEPLLAAARQDGVSAVTEDGQGWSVIALLDGVKDKVAGIAKAKQGLEKSLKDIKYDEPVETERGALVVTGTGKSKKAGVEVVFAVGVFESGPGQLAGAAFIVDKDVEDHYKETVRSICQTIRGEQDLAEAKTAAK